MAKRYVITMTAANRVGILAATTTAIGEFQGDIVEIRQTLLQGFFTMIIAVDFPDDCNGDIVREHIRAACERYGVDVTLKDPECEVVNDGIEDADAYVLELSGRDQPGIVRALSAHLARLGVDITDLHSKRRSSGHFAAVVQIAVPSDLEMDAFRVELEELAARTGLEISLAQSPGDSAIGMAIPAAGSADSGTGSKPR